jgi:hypothetical protein
MAFFRDSGEVCAYIGQMFELFVEEFGAEAALRTAAWWYGSATPPRTA